MGCCRNQRRRIRNGVADPTQGLPPHQRQAAVGVRSRLPRVVGGVAVVVSDKSPRLVLVAEERPPQPPGHRGLGCEALEVALEVGGGGEVGGGPVQLPHNVRLPPRPRRRRARRRVQEPIVPMFGDDVNVRGAVQVLRFERQLRLQVAHQVAPIHHQLLGAELVLDEVRHRLRPLRVRADQLVPRLPCQHDRVLGQRQAGGGVHVLQHVPHVLLEERHHARVRVEGARLRLHGVVRARAHRLVALVGEPCPAHEVHLRAVVIPPVVRERDHQPDPERASPVHGVVNGRPRQ
mmetsp:Transcript_30691/g.67024  ORF Transcript_30691/g.67024 Transcript_30691/m.67024 type:complete len:291 (-) Transcript_30691:1277-2149(-)